NGEVWTPVASPTYARGSVTFTTGPTATSATVYCYKPSGNALGYCDDLAVAEWTPLVSNGGFESGDLGMWSTWGGAQVVAGNARTGSYALQVGPGQSSAEQVVPVQPNTTYTVSGWARSVDPSEPIRIGVKDFGGAGEVWAPVASSTYAMGSVSFTTGPTATSATVYCYKPSGNALGYCDDLAVSSP
ncbi:carbohydrate binding domain-containing protein, partial [Pedococcus sp.]|uniref:carbohydrate binding domain-containing protein n=1 Tax=Pedococcus sp. TaxID=2860345 RepID=UPI002E144479|nr:carbohydrate binding domain-containing protein [Pedococcus sp.]